MKSLAAMTLFQLALCSALQASECPDLAQGAVFAIIGSQVTSGKQTRVEFTPAQILAIQSRKVVSDRPWAGTAVTFEGPLLRQLIAASGFTGNYVSISAKNNYSANLPVENANSFTVISKMEIDGQKYGLRNNGPIFFLRPAAPVLNKDVKNYQSYSIWKVCEVTIY
jgi:hypothetical protein